MLKESQDYAESKKVCTPILQCLIFTARFIN